MLRTRRSRREARGPLFQTWGGAGHAGAPSPTLTWEAEHQKEASSAWEESRSASAQLPMPKTPDAHLPKPTGAGQRVRGAKAKAGC